MHSELIGAYHAPTCLCRVVGHLDICLNLHLVSSWNSSCPCSPPRYLSKPSFSIKLEQLVSMLWLSKLYECSHASHTVLTTWHHTKKSAYVLGLLCRRFRRLQTVLLNIWIRNVTTQGKATMFMMTEQCKVPMAMIKYLTKSDKRCKQVRKRSKCKRMLRLQNSTNAPCLQAATLLPEHDTRTLDQWSCIVLHMSLQKCLQPWHLSEPGLQQLASMHRLYKL